MHENQRIGKAAAAGTGTPAPARWSLTAVVAGSTVAFLLAAAAGSLAAAQVWPARSGHLRIAAQTLLLVAAPLVLLQAALIARLVTRPLRELAGDAAQMRALRFDGGRRRARLGEIDALAQAQHETRRTVRQFLEISRRLAEEESFASLLAGVVRETLAASGLAAAAIYLVRPGGVLHAAAWADAAGRPGLPPPRDLPALPDVDHPLQPPVRDRLKGHAVLAPTLPPAGLEWLTGWFPGRPLTLLSVPLLNRPGEVIGILCLAHPGEARGFAPEIEGFVCALSGTIAVAIDQRRLMDEHARLFDALVRVVAGATDARSPHTGAHCQRVPILVEMLAEAAAAEGRIRLDEDERETLRVAAWLHDCGKIAVPDDVMEKATRLTTPHDRIHEVRTRFEVLRRDAEIQYWRACCAGADQTAQRRQLEAEWRNLADDFAFVARCNLGDPTLPADPLPRLRQIGARVWMRSFDDRLGISREELARKGRVPPRALPAPEHLLADRLEHFVDWLPHEPLSRTYAGARRHAPRHKRNLGEIYSLASAQGTLTPEERFLMDAHAGQTLAMLSQLPWPRRLDGVPDIAGAHHERADGSGHPRGLRGDQIDGFARLLAVADVFEALSACDRPYKSPMRLSQALALMADMVCAGHLDRDWFALLLHSGTWQRYAAAHLAPGQQDHVDVDALMRRAVPDASAAAAVSC